MKTWVRKHLLTIGIAAAYLSWATVGLLIDIEVLPNPKIEIDLFNLLNFLIIGICIGALITCLYFRGKFMELTRQFNEVTAGFRLLDTGTRLHHDLVQIVSLLDEKPNAPTKH